MSSPKAELTELTADISQEKISTQSQGVRMYVLRCFLLLFDIHNSKKASKLNDFKSYNILFNYSELYFLLIMTKERYFALMEPQCDPKRTVAI